MSPREALGKLIREMRLDADMSQAEFAQHVGVTPGAVCNWEKGRYCPGGFYIRRMLLFSPGFELELERLWRETRHEAYASYSAAAARREEAKRR